MNLKKAQASFELLLILGFSFTLTILAGGYYLTYSSEASDGLNSQQVDNMFNDIISKTSRVYFGGNGNRVTVEARLPDGIENITLERGTNGGEVFNFLNVTSIGKGGFFNSALYFPEENYILMNCTFSCFYVGDTGVFNQTFKNPGPKRVRIESRGDYVEINFIN